MDRRSASAPKTEPGYRPSRQFRADYRGVQETPLSPTRDPEHRRAIGLRRHHADWHHRFLVEKTDTERTDHLGQRQRRFHQREMRADADAGADAERQIGKAIGRWRRRHEARWDESVGNAAEFFRG